MKDLHDRKTIDLATLDSTFALPTHVFRYETLGPKEKERINRRFDAYRREKPYLAEALRRS